MTVIRPSLAFALARMIAGPTFAQTAGDQDAKGTAPVKTPTPSTTGRQRPARFPSPEARRASTSSTRVATPSPP